ncbi:ABC transporter ATP-binding protein [Mesorhizobium sp. YR577]|uniref:ABC transporter ATP-binding protein n=1 Tax=Mesorhizobium sp. YR577 TaxID=1884373 RepID=UPI0008E67E83|nr:ABC transporter ATP-binding protein [Mesorhizobium sp. YR577]SFU21172.1 peptide/nickel transport system ATP-binding protein [Mesorhizobium sp. YR577]
MTDPVMRAEKLRTSFFRGGLWHPVVRDVSFDIQPCQTVALVGESGSGKSVTALSAMRLLPPETSRLEGSIQFGGRDLLALSETEMRSVRGNEIAMIFQEPMTSLNPSLTVGDQISEVLVQHREMSFRQAKDETLRMLDKVRIPAAARRFNEYPHQLSGGMRQRIMIAIALACRPKLLIADEPTTALDVTIQAQILELIKLLQEEEDIAVLFITHDMGVVAEIADRTLVMYQGEVVESGATEEIFSNPRKPYTRALLSAVPQLGSMSGTTGPARFPLVDVETGRPVVAPEVADTVAHEADSVLEVRNLVTRFDTKSGFFGRVSGRVHAVENVSFEIKPGETLSLVGESGCGKSTTGRTIMGLTEAESGSIRLNGQEILGLRGADLNAMRRNVQMIFQDPFASLDPRMRVGAAIAEPILVHGIANREEARGKVATLLPQVGLEPEMATRFPHEFSGGQRQRICIARALAVAPKLLIADEAVSALDVSIKAQVINLMLDLQQSLGLAYLFISHDMAVVERISHRVAVMYLGEIVEIGPREAVFGNPQHPYTKRLLSAVPIPDPSRKGIRRTLSNDEIKSPIRPVDYTTPVREWRTITPGHQVQAWGDEWTETARAA